MAEKLKVKMYQRYMPSSDWIALNLILGAGEIGVESDTNKFKFGDGETAWADLPYVSGNIDTDANYLKLISQHHCYGSSEYSTYSQDGNAHINGYYEGKIDGGQW